MQLDVLSIFQLPAASSSQSGQFSLQEVAVLKDCRDQHRRRLSWSSTCGLFTCSRQSRYAVDLGPKSAQFALLRASGKPLAWVLVTDEEGRPGSIRVEPLRGYPLHSGALHGPLRLPYDDLFSMGLPASLGSTDGSALAPSMASCQLFLEPAIDVASHCSQILGHAYWWSTCPGTLVLAVARHNVDAKGGSAAGMTRRMSVSSGGTEDWTARSKHPLSWHWLVLLVADNFDYVGPAVRHASAGLKGAPSSSLESLPVLTAVLMSWHPEGHALALCLTDSAGRSCVAVLDGSRMEVLWHRRLTPEVDQIILANSVHGSPSELGACSMSWLPNSSLLAVLDSAGQLHLLDARGGRKGAALLCGAIKYGASTPVRLGPIMEKAAPLPTAALSALSHSAVQLRRARRDGSGFGVSIGGGGDRDGDGGSNYNGDYVAHFVPSPLSAPQPCRYSHAFSSVRSQALGKHARGETTGVRESGVGSLLAICNGAAVALLRVAFSDDPATPTMEYRHGRLAMPGSSNSGVTAHSPFMQQVKSTNTAPTNQSSPDRDLVPALRVAGGGLLLQVDGLDRVQSFGNSAVSTPYMLGLHCVSVSDSSIATGAGGGTFLQAASCRSASSEVPVLPPWPLRWRTLLNLPPPPGMISQVGLAGGPVVAGPLSAAATSAAGGYWAGVATSKCGPPSSIAASSVTAASKAERLGGAAGGWGAFPSPACSIATFLDHSIHEVASSAGGDAPPQEMVDSNGQRYVHPAVGLAAAATAPKAATAGGGGGGEPEALLCTAPGPLQALHQGDVLVLRGNIAEALQHYPGAHVYGFLPVFLALLHLHRIDAAARLLRAYAHFTGQVAAAFTAGGGASGNSVYDTTTVGGGDGEPVGAETPAASPAGSVSAAVLSQQWQAVMTNVLESAFIDDPVASPGGGGGVGWEFALSCSGAESDPQRWKRKEVVARWRRTLLRVQEQPRRLAAEDVHDRQGGRVGQEEGVRQAAAHGSSANETAADDTAEYDTSAGRSAGGDARCMDVNSSQAPSVDRHRFDGLSTGQGCVGLEAVADATSLKQPVSRRTSILASTLSVGATAAAVVGAAAARATDGQEDHTSQHPESGTVSSMMVSPRPSPSSALKDILVVCLQLMQLACHAMAYIAFSAHSAGRAVAAAAAVDLLALPMSPSSPRSPGGSVLSRQAMRRLSSTVRMRSMKTRSVSMFGPSPLATSPSTIAAAAGGTAAGTPSFIRSDSSQYRSSGAAAVGIAARPAQGPAAGSMVIAFPIPVVWQPQLHGCSQLRQQVDARGSALSIAQLNDDKSGGMPGHATAMFEQPTFFASSASCNSPPGSPPSVLQSLPPPTAMRLQLHHCAFDVTRLWQDASGQILPLGQSAATVYLKPSYAAGLLLMAHTCTVQLHELHRNHHHNHHLSLDHQRQQHRLDERTERLHHASSANEQLLPPMQRHHHPDEQVPAGHLGKPHQASHHVPQQPQGGMLRGSCGARVARVNWQLLRSTAAATHAAAVWHQLNDWHRAALLVFAWANALTRQGGGSEDLAQASRLPQRASDSSLTAAMAVAVVPESHDDPQAGGGGGGGGAAVAAGDRCSHLAAARTSCLRMGQGVLMSQVDACQKMEVQDACGVMVELVALPRRLLGLHSAVHISLLQKVCTRVVDLLPARVSITPLLPAGSVPPLLQLSHAGIRFQLVAHCGEAVARVLEELRLTASCGASLVPLRDAVQQIADHATVDSCVRMLLRWQGSYDAPRVDAAAARLAESVRDATLLPDTSDWTYDAVLQPLQEAFVTSGLLTVADAAAVIQAAQVAGTLADNDNSSKLGVGALAGLLAGAAGGGGDGRSQGHEAAGDASPGLQDLDELALLLDLTQLQHTLLASLQPFLHDALEALYDREPHLMETVEAAAGLTSQEGRPRGVFGSQMPAASGSWSAAALLAAGKVWEDDPRDELPESSALAALPPVELALTCLQLLLKLQWALHCRAQVCALMLHAVKLQTLPPSPRLHPAVSAVTLALAPATSPARNLTPPAISPRPPTSPTSIAVTLNNSCGSPQDSSHTANQLLAIRPGSHSGANAVSSPRSFSHSPMGHRSFREYIQHIASSSPSFSLPQPDLQTHTLSQLLQLQQDTPANVADLTEQAATRADLWSPFGTTSLREGGPPGADLLPQTPSLADPVVEQEHVQSSLMAWTAALVRADVFHCANELQGCVVTVLRVVKSCPLALVTALNHSLERREILNKALAGQVRRLQRSATQSSADVVATSAMPPSQSTTTTPLLETPAIAAAGAVQRTSTFPSASGTAGEFPWVSEARIRNDSLPVPGGAMAPAPSLAGVLPADAEALGRPGAGSAGADALCLFGTVQLSRTSLTARACGSTGQQGPPIVRVASPSVRGLSSPEALTVVAEGTDDVGDGGGSDWRPLQSNSPGSPAAFPKLPVSLSTREAAPLATQLQGFTCAASVAAAATALPVVPSVVNSGRSPIGCRPATPPPPSAAATPMVPTSPCGSAMSGAPSHMHPMQLAVSMVHADICSASLKLLEHYADPTGAMRSGLSSTAAATTQPTKSFRGVSEGASTCGSAQPPGGSSCSSHGGGSGINKVGRRRRRPLSRSSTVCRATSHSTLLQCLVCEMIRTSHSVNASVSWKATLEGGRGLASCFVHPILHGGSTAAVASTAAADSVAAAAVKVDVAGGGDGSLRRSIATEAASRWKSNTAASLAGEEATSDEGGEDLGSVPGFVPGADGAQALLLSLLNVQQWCAQLKQLPVPMARRGVGVGGREGDDVPHSTKSVAVGAVSGMDETVSILAPQTPQATASPSRGNDEPDSTGEVEESQVDARLTDDGLSSDRGPHLHSTESPQGDHTSRMSFSGLTDGENDSSGYPQHSANTANGAASCDTSSVKTSLGRMGHLSMHHHSNPTFVLHSPTASNLSEFWDETSEFASPQSTTASPQNVESRCATASDARLLWQAGSSPAGPDADGSPQVAQVRSVEPLPFSSSLAGTAAAKVMLGSANTGVLDNSATIGVGDHTGTALAPAPAVLGSTPRATHADVDAGIAITAAATSSVATKVAPGDAVEVQDGEQEQLPTLSYLINVNTLAELRRAVQEAHDRDSDLSDDAADVDIANAPVAAVAPRPIWLRTSSQADEEATVGSSGGGAIGAGFSETAVVLTTERSCSFGAPPWASTATSISEVSVRDGMVSALLATYGWPGPEPHDASGVTDPRTVTTDDSEPARTSAALAAAIAAAADDLEAAGTGRADGFNTMSRGVTVTSTDIARKELGGTCSSAPSQGSEASHAHALSFQVCHKRIDNRSDCNDGGSGGPVGGNGGGSAHPQPHSITPALPFLKPVGQDSSLRVQLPESVHPSLPLKHLTKIETATAAATDSSTPSVLDLGPSASRLADASSPGTRVIASSMNLTCLRLGLGTTTAAASSTAAAAEVVTTRSILQSTPLRRRTDGLTTVDSTPTTATPSSTGDSRIQLQDFLRDPSSAGSSNASPWGLASEFLQTPDSATGRSTRSTLATATSPNNSTGMSERSGDGGCDGGGGLMATSLIPSLASMDVAPAVSIGVMQSTWPASGRAFQSQHLQPQQQQHAKESSSTDSQQLDRYRISSRSHSSASRGAVAGISGGGRSSRRRSSGGAWTPSPRLSLLTPASPKPVSRVSTSAKQPSPHQHQRRGSREVHQNSSNQVVSHLHPSYEAEQGPKGSLRAALGTGGSSSSVGNPLFGALSVALYSGGSPSGEGQRGKGSGGAASTSADTSRGSGAGGGAGKGGSRLQSTRGNSFSRASGSSGRLVWH